MKHKKFDEYEIAKCKLCAAIFLMRKQQAKFNHEEILNYRAEELLNEN